MSEGIKESIRDIIRFLEGLDSGAYFVHLKYLNDLLDFTDDEQKICLEKINSAELWGGSGALWESEYAMNGLKRKDFERLLLNLLEEMKKEKILGKGAKSVYKILAS